jgi:hypothetical protein
MAASRVAYFLDSAHRTKCYQLRVCFAKAITFVSLGTHCCRKNMTLARAQGVISAFDLLKTQLFVILDKASLLVYCSASDSSSLEQYLQGLGRCPVKPVSKSKGHQNRFTHTDAS